MILQLNATYYPIFHVFLENGDLGSAWFTCWISFQNKSLGDLQFYKYIFLMVERKQHKNENAILNIGHNVCRQRNSKVSVCNIIYYFMLTKFY